MSTVPPVSTYIVLVKLTPSGVEITPDDLHVCRGKYQIEWRLDRDSRPFAFSQTQMFAGATLPFTAVNFAGTRITCIDDNQNATGGDKVYTYKLLLRPHSGAIIAYPSPDRAGPYIRNKPS